MIKSLERTFQDKSLGKHSYFLPGSRFIPVKENVETRKQKQNKTTKTARIFCLQILTSNLHSADQ